MNRKSLMELGVNDTAVADKIIKALQEEEKFNQQNRVNDGEGNGAMSEIETEYEEKIKMIALKAAIKEAGGKNVKAILALIDLENISVEEDGSLTGVDFAELKEKTPYLFEKEEKQIRGTGIASYAKKRKTDETAKQFKEALMRKRV